MRALLSTTLVGFAVMGFGPSAEAKVFHSKQGALRLAFPGADKVKAKNLFLSWKQFHRASKLSGTRLRSRMLTVYVGIKKGRCQGFALIDTHRVRTLPETFMTVLGKNGKVRAVHILAFHEPKEYLPSKRWLAQFKNRRPGGKLRMGHEVAGIAGATLSAHAVTRATRRLLALYTLLLKPANGRICK